MRLHRLALTNYRGIAHRDIEFPDHGVTVVSGANEAGKSSMIEALDLLLESKDRSSKKEVKEVKPTHADVGAEVTAEISAGPYRFVYRKRFHKKCETELTVLAPRREQLTGDEAHDRVRAMLDETVDTGLWQAQRVLQSKSTSAVQLAGCDALSRALDIAAGDAATAAGLSGAEPVLIEKIDAEYARYFTPTGRPTGEWLTATNRLQAAEQEVAQCAADVAEVDDRVRRHAILTAELSELTGRQEAVTVRHEAAEAAAAVVAALADQLREAMSIAGVADATAAAAAAADLERGRLRADAEARAAAAVTADAAATEAAEAEAVGREVVVGAETAAAAAVEALGAARERAEAARRLVTQLAERDEADRLSARLGRIDTAQGELEGVIAELAAVTMTDSIIRAAEAAAGAVAVAGAQVELTAPNVEFIAESDIELMVGAERVSLAAGQTWSLTASESMTVRLPGLLTAQVDPGATAIDSQAKLAAAQQHLQDILFAGGVADLTEARLVDERRRELLSRQDQLGATLIGLRGDEEVDQLRTRLSILRADQPAEVSLWDAVDVAGARAALAEADDALKRAVGHCETQRKVATAAAAQLAQRSTDTVVSREKATAARAELTTVGERLAAQRALVTDAELAAAAQTATVAARQAGERAAELSARLVGAGPEAAGAELTAARTAAEALGRRRDEVDRVLHDVTVELAVFGTEGRTGKLDAAQIHREHAAAAHGRIHGRARAAQLLRSVMARHRDNTRLRYVEPFRSEVERLGRTVFGPTFEIEVDSDLQIRNRTLDGRTVPYESLSGGAKEQLGLVTRLAVAALVDKEDTVPVMIDDALGFTDPDRLTKMAAVLDVAGAHGQVVVLTCVPDRYRGVQGAHHIEVSA